MAARMQPQPSRRWDLADDSHEELALIVPFPTSEWDRLERWAQKQTRKQDEALAARNAALSRI
jgi:hypothetical protein